MTLKFGGLSSDSHNTQAVNNPTYYIDSYGRFGVLDIDTGARQVIKTGFDKLMDIAGTANGDLYGVSNGKLYSIDPSNGNLTLIGSTPSFTGFGASDDALYGVTGNKIYTVNPQTGAATQFATFNGFVAGDLVVVDNALYITTTSDQLVKYDLATGQQSVLVNNLPGASTYGIAVDSNGDIVGVNTHDQGYKVDVDTGAVTLAANVSGTTINDMASVNSASGTDSVIVDGENFDEVMNPGYNDANGPTNGGGDIIDGADGDDDIIYGNGGDDTINAGQGNDIVYGDSGDSISAGGTTGSNGSGIILGELDSEQRVDGTLYGRFPGTVYDGNFDFSSDAFYLGDDIGILDGANRNELRGQTFSQDGDGTDRVTELVDINYTGAQKSFVGLATVNRTALHEANDQFSASNGDGFQDVVIVNDVDVTFRMNDGTVYEHIRMQFLRGDDGKTYLVADDHPREGTFNSIRTGVLQNDSGIDSFQIESSSGNINGINPIVGNWGAGQFREVLDGTDGEGGDDIITGGEGADTMFGEGGNDTFIVGSATEGAGDVIVGGNGPDQNTDNDVLDLRGAGIVTIDDAADENDAGARAGTVTFDNGQTLEFSQIETILQDTAPTTITITAAPDSPVDDEGRPLTAENGAPAQIVVSLDAPALEDTVVTLTNGDPTEINPPLTVTIPAGQTSVLVDVPSVDDPDVDGTQIAPIEATAPGLTGDTIEVAVADDDVAELTIAPVAGTPVDENGNPVTSENGDPVTLEITRTGPTDEPLVVTLTSDDPTEGTVPQTVTIPAGQDSVTFEVTPVDDPLVDGTQFPTITAEAEGFEPVEEVVAVADDDTAPTTITITAAPDSPVDDEGRPLTAENGAPAQIVVSLDAPALEDTVVTLTNGDPTEINPPLTVTIPAGQTSVLVDVPSVDDPDVDGTQIAPIEATAPGLTGDTIEVAVADDDVAELTIAPVAGTPVDENGNPVTAENGDPVTLEITRTGPTDEPLVVTLTSDDPTEGTVPQTVTIPAGQDSVTFEVTPVDDPLVDGTQFPTITAEAEGFEPVEQDVAVLDDDTAPTTITITAAPNSPVDDEGRPLTAENGAPAQIVVSLDAPALEDTVVTLTNGDPTEINPPLTVTIPAGQTSVLVDVPSVDDPDVDGTQIAPIEATAPGLTGDTIEVAVADDDVAELTIAPVAGTPVDENGNPVTSENGDPVTLEITRTGPTDEPLVVTLTSDDPTEGTVPQTVTIPAGQDSVTFEVTPVDDPLVDGTQFPTITAEAEGFEPVEEVVAVADDDTAPTTITITAAPDSPVDDEGRPLTAENGAPAQIVVSLDAPALEDTVVTLTNGDPTEINPPLTVTIPAGQTSVLVDVPSVDDPDVDGTQIAPIEATAPGLTGDTIEVAVADDDVAELTIAPVAGTPVDENGNPVTAENGDPVTLEITRTGPTDEPLVVTLTSDDPTEGTVPQTVTIPAGQDSVTFEVTPVDDPLVDGTQFPTITAEAEGFEPVEQDVAVLDDDTAPTTITITAAPNSPVDDEGRPLTAENGAPAQIVVSLDAPALEDTVVTLTNGDPTEINPPLTVTIPAGQTSVLVDVPSVDDPDVDGTQIAPIEATAPGLTGDTIEVAVADDDVAELTIAPVAGTPVDENGNPVTSENGDPVTLEITRTGPTDEPLVVTLTSDDPTEGTVPQTVTIPAGQDSVTFEVTPVDDPLVDGTQFPTITAEAEGFEPVEEVVAVADDDTAPTTITITAAPNSPVDDEGRPLTAENGAPAQIVVSLDAPALEDTVVTLTNGDPTEINPPLTVTIPAGQTSVLVDVPSVDDPDVDGTQIAPIEATAPGLTGDTIEVAVADDDVAELTIAPVAGTPVDENGNPVTSENGDPVTLEITRTGPTDEPLVVTLTSDDPTEGTVPQTVTIPAGQDSVTFEVTPVDDHDVDGTQTPTITATADGFEPVAQDVAVLDDDTAPTTGTIKGRFTFDDDSNDNEYNDETNDWDVGVSGVTIKLLDLDGKVVATTVTTSNGSYSFTVASGVYQVQFPSVEGKEFSLQNSGVEEHRDSDADVNGLTEVIDLSAGGTVSDIDAGVKDIVDVVAPTTVMIAAAPGTPVDDEGRPLTAENGAPAQIVVSLDAPALEDTVITLTNDDPSETDAPTTVTILAGETSVIVDVPSVDDTDVDGTQIAPISASAPGLTGDTIEVAVEDDDSVAVNLPPVAVHDVIDGGVENTPEIINIADILENDSDPEGNPLTVVSVQSAKNGTVEYDAETGEITFTPNDGFVGLATFTYTIADDKGLESTAEVCVEFKQDTNSNPGQIINGTDGNNFLVGTDGDDTISGRAGDDLIQGGKGDDLIQGGKGDDVMDGGLGADTFVWELSDLNFGSGASSDTIFGFEAQDTLDLRDLLQGEEHSDEGSVAEALDNYLHFSVSDEGDTVLEVSALGSFEDGNKSGDHCVNGDQQITLSNVDLTAGNTLSDVEIINNLLANNQLITD